MFRNREEAGKRLAERLRDIKGDLIVLAIPRGGVVVGKVLSQVLSCPLDILVVKKIGAPYNPELAVGAIGPDNIIIWNYEILGQLGLKETDLIEEIKNEKFKMKNYIEKFKKKETSLAGKTVILTDDGIATGATIEAAIAWIKMQKPKKIFLAVPVAPPEVVEKFKNLVDELVVLETPAFFGAVGQFYEEFLQVEDEEVVRLLQ